MGHLEPVPVRPDLDLVRAALRLVGPAKPSLVAGFLDSAAEPPDERTVRLVGPYELSLQARDRELLVPDVARHKALWPVLGRPGGVPRGLGPDPKAPWPRQIRHPPDPQAPPQRALSTTYTARPIGPAPRA